MCNVHNNGQRTGSSKRVWAGDEKPKMVAYWVFAYV